MCTSSFRKNRGFVALMSVILIGVMLSIMMYTLGISTFFSRVEVLDFENKRTSLELAEGCVNVAMLKLSQGTPVLTAETISVDPDRPEMHCTICSALLDGEIEVRAMFHDSYTNVSLKILRLPGHAQVTYWNEKAVADTPLCTLSS